MDKLFRTRRRRERRTYESTASSTLQQTVTPRSVMSSPKVQPSSVVTPRSLAKSRTAATPRSRREPRSSTPRPPVKKSTPERPPVLVRSGRSALPVEARVASQPRRRYDISLSVPGAEVRLPALPTFQFNERMISGVAFLLLAALLIYLWTSPNYHVEMAETLGNQRVTNSDINTVIGVYEESIFSMDPAAITEQLQKAFPDFKAVSVKVKLPNHVIITIVERQPVLAWQQGGSVSWIDSEGVAFPPRGEMQLVMVDAKDAPPGTVIDPVQRTTQFDPKWVTIFQKMAEQAPAGVPILYSAERGLGWVDPQGWEAYFGTDFSNMEQKLLVYAALVARLQQDGIQPNLVSVEFVHAPYYRVEP
jgi:hypothetical protein